MKAAVVHTLGQPPRFEDFAEPVAEHGEALVRVQFSGVHPLVKALVKGSHYGSRTELPFIAGVDGVGLLEDGTQVYCGMARAPFGMMAERTVVPRARCIPLPPGADGATVAGSMNPGLSAFLALTWRGQLAQGQTVLIIGATGAGGHLAVQIAKRLGAGRVIAMGRDQPRLDGLRKLGADATISLRQEPEAIAHAVAQEAAEGGIQIIVDYLWSKPTEAVLAGLMRT
jgi:NADPH:quinone reductase-like Zn-dependent oxidoreductase